MLAERECRLALACVVEAGDPRVAELVARYGAEETWRRTLAGATDRAWTARAQHLDLRRVEVETRRGGGRFVVPGDAEWPERLGDLEFCEPIQKLGGVPVGLWVRGEMPLADAVERSVAIVGSRASTAYGERVAADLAGGLALDGIAVVSGGAFGVDAAAHRGALGEDGITVALLACGVDTPYPRQHDGLLARVAESGALVSEYPPGEHPTRPRFLARNRLIAALSQATVVVEGAMRSGARNTASWANGCLRPLLAVPGPVTNATSFTPHHLIRHEGATLVTSVTDIREAVSPLGTVEQQRPRREQLVDLLGAEERAVLESVPSRGGRTAGELSLRAGLTMPATLAALEELAEGGLVSRRPDGRWRLGEVTNRPVLTPVPDAASDPGSPGAIAEEPEGRAE